MLMDAVNSLQVRLEKHHAEFLSRFGPCGLVMPCGTRLIASKYRGPIETSRGKKCLGGRSGANGIDIPDELLEGMKAIHDAGSPSIIEDASESESEQEWRSRPKVKSKVKGKGKGKGKGKKEGKRSAPDTGSPIKDVHQISTRTPVSHARASPDENEGNDEEDEEDDEARQWARQWAGSVSASALLAAMEQGDHTEPSIYSRTGPEERGTSHLIQQATSLLSSDPTEPADIDHPPQQWVMATPMGQIWSPQPVSYLEADHAWTWPNTFPEASTSASTETAENPVDAEEAAVAAESLLNLHSTPLRPTTHVERMTPFKPPLQPPPVISITPRPHPVRARSFVQPFARARLQAPARSLSFFNATLEDPFLLNPVTLPPRTIARPTLGSPLAPKRKIAPSPSPVQPLRTRPQNHNHNMYTTPLRRTPMHIPSSVWRESVVCSPNADLAARLGLAPAAMIFPPGGFASGMSETEGTRRKRVRTKMGMRDEDHRGEGEGGS
jgi:hypothetical protein